MQPSIMLYNDINAWEDAHHKRSSPQKNQKIIYRV